MCKPLSDTFATVVFPASNAIPDTPAQVRKTALFSPLKHHTINPRIRTKDTSSCLDLVILRTLDEAGVANLGLYVQ